jgi:hypothetical protein
MIQQGEPVFDQANNLIPLAATPARLVTKKITTPDGELLVHTIRTPTTTLTVLLDGKTAKAWTAQMARESAPMSSSGIIVANGAVPP